MGAVPIKVGDTIKTYTVKERLGSGEYTIWFRAQDQAGHVVFLKEYKSPPTDAHWYKGWVAYQDEIKRRIDASKRDRVKGFYYYTCPMIDWFEEKYPKPGGCLTYFQVFEFIDEMRTLQTLLDERPSLPWKSRVILSKMLVRAVASMHSLSIVHCDLKPENIVAVSTRAELTSWRILLTDLDWAILADRRAPWHGTDRGYVGTPGYRSPEHLRGQVPQPASDVFTCGIILYQLLADGSPFPADEASYARAVLHLPVELPRFAGAFPPPAKSDTIARCIRQCLDLDPAKRPTAEQVWQELVGFSSTSPPPPAPPLPTRPASRDKPRLCLVAQNPPPSGARLPPIGVTTKVGRRFVAPVCEEGAKYWDDHQFTCEKRPDGWYLVAAPGTKNGVKVNGRPIEGEVLLTAGDVITIGRKRDIDPLRVEFVD